MHARVPADELEGSIETLKLPTNLADSIRMRLGAVQQADEEVYLLCCIIAVQNNNSTQVPPPRDR